ncbi:MAG: CPBP family intramembrane metalloprotease [Phycisphaeraceae bacterium]|nr:CPBP family intramembrane metalloprotease [Phycisphaeraceae bacterium]
MTTAKRPARRKPAAKPSRSNDSAAAYSDLSTRPLHILVFLAPLLVLYEIGSILYLSNPSTGAVETISARRMISAFFEIFGAFGLYLPGLVLATVLLVWHTLRKDRWTVQLPVIPVMAMESIVWTIPLVVVATIIPFFVAAAELAPLAGPTGTNEIHRLSTQARLTIAIGAGLYEELVFRVVCIAIIHTIVVDVLGAKKQAGAIAAVLFSAIAFTLYHDLRTPAGNLNLPLTAFLFFAGVYFGILYIWRGFGIVVGVHALYDVVALVLLPASRSITD